MLPRCASVLCQGHDMLRSEHDGRLQSAIGGINGDRSHTSNRRSRSDTRILEHYLRRLPYRYAQAKDDYPYRYAQAKARSPESIRQEEIDALKVRECPLSRRRHATL